MSAKKGKADEKAARSADKAGSKGSSTGPKILSATATAIVVRFGSKLEPVVLSVYDALNCTCRMYLADGVEILGPEDRTSFLTLDSIKVEGKENTWEYKLPSGDWQKLPLSVTAMFFPKAGSNVSLRELQTFVVEKRQGGMGVTARKPKVDDVIMEHLQALMLRASYRGPDDVWYVDSKLVRDLMDEIAKLNKKIGELKKQVAKISELEEKKDALERQVASQDEEFQSQELTVNDLKQKFGLPEDADHKDLILALQQFKDRAEKKPEPAPESEPPVETDPKAPTKRRETDTSESVVDPAPKKGKEFSTAEINAEKARFKLAAQRELTEEEIVKLKAAEGLLKECQADLATSRAKEAKPWVFPGFLVSSLAALVFFVLFVAFASRPEPVIPTMMPASTPSSDTDKVDRGSYDLLQIKLAEVQATASRQLDELSSENSRLKSSISSLEEQRDRLERERDNARSESSRLSGELASVREKASSDAETSKKRIASLESEKAGLKSSASDLEKEKTKLEGKVSELEAEKETLERRVSELGEQVATLTREKGEAKTTSDDTIEAKDREIQDLKKQLAAMISERDIARKEREKVRAEAKRLTGELSSVREKLTALTEEAKKNATLSQRAATAMEELQKKVKALEEQVAGLTRELGVERTRVSQRDAKIKQLNEDLEKIKALAAEKQVALEKERTTVALLRSQLREREGIEVLRGKWRTALGQRDSARAQAAQLEKELGDVRKQLVDAQASASLVPGLQLEVRRLASLLSPVRALKLDPRGRLTFPEELAPAGTRLWQVQEIDRQVSEPQGTGTLARVIREDRIFLIHFFNEYGGLLRTYVARAANTK
jgi:DNA repair exonuclease SbcCD ATPase subunit